MKTSLTAMLMALVSTPVMANCVMELQLNYNGRVLPMDEFTGGVAPQCREARKACNQARREFSRNHNFMLEDITCSSVGSAPIPPVPVPTPVPPGPMDPNPMGRAEALRILENAEGNVNQGRENYEIIMNYVDNGQVFLSEGVNTFVTILNTTGSGKTDDARNIFYSVMDISIQRGESPMVLANAIVDLNSVEGNPAQALEGLQLVNTLNAGVTVSEGVSEYIKVLSNVGAGKTDEAIRLFTTIVNSMNPSLRLGRVVDGAMAIFRIEGNANQTGENIVLVNQATQRAGVNFNMALNDLIDLLNRYGAGNTDSVQRNFRTLYNL